MYKESLIHNSLIYMISQTLVNFWKKKTQSSLKWQLFCLRLELLSIFSPNFQYWNALDEEAFHVRTPQCVWSTGSTYSNAFTAPYEKVSTEQICSIIQVNAHSHKDTRVRARTNTHRLSEIQPRNFVCLFPRAVPGTSKLVLATGMWSRH